jgi:hypothetical protein
MICDWLNIEWWMQGELLVKMYSCHLVGEMITIIKDTATEAFS